MKKTKRICGLLLTFTLALFVLGCGGVEKEILGKWNPNYPEEEIIPGNYLEFFSDNTYMWKEGSDIEGGKWTILDDGRLKLESDSRPYVVEVKIEGDKMIEVDPGIRARS